MDFGKKKTATKTPRVATAANQTQRTIAELAKLLMDMRTQPGVYAADVDRVIALLVKVTNIVGKESAEHLGDAMRALAQLRPQYPDDQSERFLMLATRQPLVAPRSALENETSSIEDSIRAVENAYLRVTGGKRNVFVRLADVRAVLGDEIDRELVDWILRRLQSHDEAVLYPIDDPQRYLGKPNAKALKEADAAAAISVSGERRDLLLMR